MWLLTNRGSCTTGESKRPLAAESEQVLKTALSGMKNKAQSGDGGVYIRFDHDECTVSLDTSGEALYRRTPGKDGPCSHQGKPCSSIVLQSLADGGGEAVGFSIVDPMAGSGTFLSEAVTFWDNRRTGFAFREFPFLNSQENETPDKDASFRTGQTRAFSLTRIRMWSGPKKILTVQTNCSSQLSGSFWRRSN